MIQHSRLVVTVLGLLLVSLLLSACGAAPVAEYWPGLTLAGNTLYAISGQPQKVYILDTETGMQKATFMPQGVQNGLFYWSPVTLGGDLAFVGFSDLQARTAGLYAFDPATGQELWHVPAEDLVLPAPTYADGVVYFGDSGGQVYAVDAESKTMKPGWPFKVRQSVWASPLVVDGRVYVAAMDHHLYCLEAETGQEQWSTKVGGAMASQPVLDASTGILYVGAFDGHVYAIHADSGDLVEGFDFKAGNWIWGEVLLADGRLYVASLDGRLHALDPTSGQVISPFPYDAGQVDNTKTAIRAAPVQAGESIVVATQSGRVVAVNQNAQTVWSWPSGVVQSPIYTTPLVLDGRVYVVLVNGQVQALDANNGVPGWSFTPPAPQ